MSPLRISLFGRLRCVLGDREIIGLDARRVQELLIFLLLHRQRPHSREALATLLWGDRNGVQAKKYLRQTLWQLQSALDGAGDGAQAELLRVTPDWIELNPNANVWLDIDIFERAYVTTRSGSGGQLLPNERELLQQAINLYEGDLLEGWYQDWCIFERERFQSMFLAMADKLVSYAESTGDYAMGVHYCELTLRYDHARERSHRRLMRLYYLAGNRTAALRQYETCVVMLRRELSVEPAQSTVALYEQIRRDELALPAAPLAHAVDAPSVDELYAQLKTLQDALSVLQGQVNSCLSAIERTRRPVA